MTTAAVWFIPICISAWMLWVWSRRCMPTIGAVMS